MKRNWKKHIAMLLAAVLTFVAVWQWMPVGVREVRAEAEEISEVNGADGLVGAFNTANDGSTVTVRLTGDIVLSAEDLKESAKFQLTGGNLTLDLNGHQISASAFASSYPIFLSSSDATLTIEDNSTGGGGSIASASGGKCIQATGGTLNIKGGNFQNASQCLEVSNTTVIISGNPSFVTDGNGRNDIALMMAGDNTTVNISGGSFRSSYGTVWVMDAVTDGVQENGSSLNISGGTFTANEKNSYAYVCSVNGACKVNISGGTFTLNPAEGLERVGSALVLGASATDDMVNISGGTFHGRIAREISDTSNANYEVFYGTGDSGGIIDKDSVLTNNTFEPETSDSNSNFQMYFTQDEVQVVPGSLVTFNTRRSLIESYGTDETALAHTADKYSMDPISVTADGKSVYANTNNHVLPVVEKSRIKDGNNYTFSGWYDEEGTAYATLQDFVNTGEMAGTGKRVRLIAGWKAQTDAENGLKNALVNRTVVSEIELIKDIVLSASIDEGRENEPISRILNLGGHTISSAAGTTALVLYSPWTIKNGAINSKSQPCLEIGGTATIENLDCLAENASYAVKFGNASSANRIISGTFEATGTKGHALCTTNATTEDITNLFGDSYASSTPTVTDDDGNICLSASRLIVSQSPITYIGNGADLDLGSHVYGENVPVSTQVIGNEEYMGDIVITGVSVDNPVFTVTGEGKPKTLRGGVSQTESSYTYQVGVVKNTNAGSYTGTITVSYTKMDGSKGNYTRKLALTITPKQLTIVAPTVTKEKVYDGTTTAQVTAGALEGVVTGDEVCVSATGTYDSADVGTGKKITVKYTLAGADKGNYLPPVDTEITDGSITPKQLTIAAPTVTKEKAYDGTTTAQVSAGALEGVVTGDEVSVSATAAYDSEDVGTGKKITVKYTLAGADKENYLPPIDTEITDGSITPQPPKKGDVAADDKASAKVEITNVTKKEVTYREPANKKAKTVSIPATVKINGVTYKVTKIADNAFKNNKTVTKVTVGSNITTIGKNAFYKCTSLTKITIPSKVKKIGKQAFYGCKKLKTITIKTTKLTSKNVESKAFKGIYSKATIKVPKSKLTSYKKILKAKGVSSKAKIKK